MTERWRALLRGLLRIRLRSASRLRRLVRAWRGSLQVRVVTSTLIGGLVAVGLVGMYLSDRIRDGLFEERLAQVLEESARSTSQAQGNIDAAVVSTAPQVDELFDELVRALAVGGSGEREVILRRSPGETATLRVNDVSSSSDPTIRRLISEELREAVRTDDAQHWQSVGIPEADEAGVRPGLMIGSLVTVPAAGQYELYFLYDLSGEQGTLAFVQRIMGLAAIGLIALLGGMTYMVTRQTVHPVRRAARVAERLADGHLAERMTVRGVDEMATLAASFNEMAESLQDQIQRMEELSHLQRRFVSDVSHELRTPLTTIRMAAEVIHASREGLNPAAARSAELLTAQLDRFEELLADLLEISRFDAGAAMLDAESMDVRDVVTGAVEQAALLAQRRQVWLRVDLPEQATIADVDPRRVERVLRNLLVNAIEHAEGRPVEVRLGADDRAVAITVRDHGVGMTPEEAVHVFDRFWRADPARARTTGGTGLGLAISVEDAHLHGGRLEAWGRPAAGACFRLTVPRRAGITLVGSPLPLEPEPDADGPSVSYSPHLGRPHLDPAGVPELEHWEV